MINFKYRIKTPIGIKSLNVQQLIVIGSITSIVLIHYKILIYLNTLTVNLLIFVVLCIIALNAVRVDRVWLFCNVQDVLELCI